jgi:hypothetical protein
MAFRWARFRGLIVPSQAVQQSQAGRNEYHEHKNIKDCGFTAVAFAVWYQFRLL